MAADRLTSSNWRCVARDGKSASDVANANTCGRRRFAVIATSSRSAQRSADVQRNACVSARINTAATATTIVTGSTPTAVARASRRARQGDCQAARAGKKSDARACHLCAHSRASRQHICGNAGSLCDRIEQARTARVTRVGRCYHCEARGDASSGQASVISASQFVPVNLNFL